MLGQVWHSNNFWHFQIDIWSIPEKSIQNLMAKDVLPLYYSKGCFLIVIYCPYVQSIFTLLTTTIQNDWKRQFSIKNLNFCLQGLSVLNVLLFNAINGDAGFNEQPMKQKEGQINCCWAVLMQKNQMYLPGQHRVPRLVIS